MTSKEKNIEKDINEIMDYIKELKEENKKQKEILEILKSSIMLIENKQITLGYGKYKLAIRPDIILSDDTIQIIKGWLDEN